MNTQNSTLEAMETQSSTLDAVLEAVPTNTIQMTLSDLSGLDPSVATAYVGGWINGGAAAGTFQILQSDGTFGNAISESFTVDATQPWQDTGILITQNSQITLTVTYVSGEWTADPNTNNGNLYDANGCPNLNIPANQTAYPMVGVPMGALIGKIGSDGTPFLIRRGPQIITSATGGELYLCINDDLNGVYGAGLTDNSGSVTVAIAQGLPFYSVASIPTVDLTANTNGNDRLIFMVAQNQPAQMPIFLTNPMQYTSYPYANEPGPGLAAPGPFDVFEFGMNAAADLSAVNGFGLNLSFTYNGTSYGVDQSVSRKQVGKAFQAFIKNEAKSDTNATAYAELFYDASIGGSAPTPPAVGGQFFAIADPNDMLQAKVIQGTASSDGLTTYWDDTMSKFFAVGNYLSINIGSSTYSGECTMQTMSGSQSQTPTFTLSNGTNSYNFYMPAAGIDSALYVFMQAFNKYTPGSGGDGGLLQDCMWEAFSRGVAMDGIFTSSKNGGESTTAWNNPATWYQAGKTCHLYAKFLHYSTVDGTDSRISGNGDPIMYNNAAYGFSMDESPIGPYNGGEVPSKTEGNVPGGSTISIVLGPWA